MLKPPLGVGFMQEVDLLFRKIEGRLDQRAQVVHQAAEQPRFVIERGNLASLQRVHAVEHGAQVALQHRERRAAFTNGIAGQENSAVLQANRIQTAVGVRNGNPLGR